MSHVDLLELPEVETASSDETADCLCGVPSCQGHEEINGEVHIPNPSNGIHHHSYSLAFSGRLNRNHRLTLL
jgi:hypothetical protein